MIIDTTENILYVGGFNFIKNTASSIRVIENAKFLEKLKFKVEVLGKIANIQSSTFYVDNIKVSNIENENHNNFASDISAIKLKLKTFNANYIIAYNYPPIAFYKLLKFCQKNKIELIPDLTEWYGIDGRFTLDKGLRFVLHQWRMLYLNKKCKHKIIASNYLEKYYAESNNLLLPFVTVTNSLFENKKIENTDSIKFIYAGSPGNNFSKDRLDIVIKAFAKVKENNTNFIFNIVGLTKKELCNISTTRQDVNFLDSNLKCFGRLKSDECISLIKSSDIVIFSRDINRVSSAGFPTKVFEAFKYGLPTLTNKTSDIDKYINKENGFLVENANLEEFSSRIHTILTSKKETLELVINNCRNDNPFYYTNYVENTKLFFKKINL